MLHTRTAFAAAALLVALLPGVRPSAAGSFQDLGGTYPYEDVFCTAPGGSGESRLLVTGTDPHAHLMSLDLEHIGPGMRLVDREQLHPLQDSPEARIWSLCGDGKGVIHGGTGLEFPRQPRLFRWDPAAPEGQGLLTVETDSLLRQAGFPQVQEVNSSVASDSVAYFGCFRPGVLIEWNLSADRPGRVWHPVDRARVEAYSPELLKRLPASYTGEDYLRRLRLLGDGSVVGTTQNGFVFRLDPATRDVELCHPAWELAGDTEKLEFRFGYYLLTDGQDAYIGFDRAQHTTLARVRFDGKGGHTVKAIGDKVVPGQMCITGSGPARRLVLGSGFRVALADDALKVDRLQGNRFEWKTELLEAPDGRIVQLLSGIDAYRLVTWDPAGETWEEFAVAAPEPVAGREYGNQRITGLAANGTHVYTGNFIRGMLSRIAKDTGKLEVLGQWHQADALLTLGDTLLLAGLYPEFEIAALDLRRPWKPARKAGARLWSDEQANPNFYGLKKPYNPTSPVAESSQLKRANALLPLPGDRLLVGTSVMSRSYSEPAPLLSLDLKTLELSVFNTQTRAPRTSSLGTLGGMVFALLQWEKGEGGSVQGRVAVYDMNGRELVSEVAPSTPEVLLADAGARRILIAFGTELREYGLKTVSRRAKRGKGFIGNPARRWGERELGGNIRDLVKGNDGLVYVACGNRLVSIDGEGRTTLCATVEREGKPVEVRKLAASSDRTDRTVYLGAGDGHVYAWRP